MADFQSIAEQFVKFYYQTFDSNRAELAALYRGGSMMTWEREPFLGAQNIVEKLSSLPFERVAHQVTTTDAQPGAADGSIVVLVTGALQIDDQPQPMSYVQTFSLMPEAGSYYVYNDVFRLVYPPS